MLDNSMHLLHPNKPKSKCYTHNQFVSITLNSPPIRLCQPNQQGSTFLHTKTLENTSTTNRGTHLSCTPGRDIRFIDTLVQ